MPELPEVESTAAYLHEKVRGARITRFRLRWAPTLATGDSKTCNESLARGRIVSVGRRGKFVVLRLAASGAEPRIFYLLIHLRMSGSLEVLPRSEPLDRHDRAVIELADGRDIRFCDMRKFGRIFLADRIEEVTGRLGPEPLNPEFSSDWLVKSLSKRTGCIKPLLLNQSFIAGIGNIYADEALWRARIHPRSCAGQLRPSEVRSLHTAIRAVLQDAISASGTDFGDGVVEMGGYRPRCYGRDGLPCKRCRSLLRKIRVGQRGTHFCPACQKIRKSI